MMRWMLSLIIIWSSHCNLAFANRSLNSKPVLSRNALEIRQSAAVVSSSSFLRRSFTASAIAGSYIYIDGGEFSSQVNGVSNFEFGSSLLSIDLSHSWTNATVNIQSTPKPEGVPTLVSPSLWYSEKNNLLYTGYTGRTSFFGPVLALPLTLWSLKPDGSGAGTWNNTLDSPLDFQVSRSFAPLQAYGGETAVVLGGMANPGVEPKWVNLTQQLPLPGLVSFDMASNTFTNTSTSGKTVYGGDGFAVNGVMPYVPNIGSKGIFIAMGGSVDAAEVPETLQSFTTVSVYNPATKQWYNQTTTGDIPLARLKSCTAGVASSNGTYEILLYAGFGGVLGSEAIPYDDAHILTLPAFHWIKVDSFTAKHPRYGQSCNAVGGSQILTIGGVDANPAIPLPGPDNVTSYQSTLNTTADPFTQGLGIFDMTTLSFASSYNANAGSYIQSDPVVQYYAQNPSKTLDSPGLQALFQTTSFPPPQPPTTPPPPTTSSSSSSSFFPSTTSPSSSTSTNRTRTITATTLSALLLLLLLTGSLLYYLQRRRIKQDARGARLKRFHSAWPITDRDKNLPPTPISEMSASSAFGDGGNAKVSSSWHLCPRPVGMNEIGPSSKERPGMAELPDRGSGVLEAEHVEVDVKVPVGFI